MSRKLTSAIAVVACLAVVTALGRLVTSGREGPSESAAPGPAVACADGAEVAAHTIDDSRTRSNEIESALRTARGYADPILDEIERAGGPALTRRIDAYRQAINDVSPALESLEARQEVARHSVLAESVLAVWRELLRLYYEAAPSPAHRRQLEARYPAATEAACQNLRFNPTEARRIASARY